MAMKVAELNKVVAPEPDTVGGNVSAAGIVPVDTVNSDNVYRDKAQVIDALKKKGSPFDARASKDKLEELLRV